MVAEQKVFMCSENVRQFGEREEVTDDNDWCAGLPVEILAWGGGHMGGDKGPMGGD